MARRQGATRRHVLWSEPDWHILRPRRNAGAGPFSTQPSGPQFFRRISASLARPVSQRIQALRSLLEIRQNSSRRLASHTGYTTLNAVMIYVHSIGRAVRYFPELTALAANGKRSTFRELHARVERIAAGLTKHGFKPGDRLAILLPNEPDYIQLVYACAWLGVIAVPLNTRLSIKEIDGILSDANPRGLIRHSSLPVPTAQVSWQLVLDQEPLEVQSDSIPDPIYDPDAILALIYTSGTTGQPKGVEMRHSNILENVYHTNFWFPLEEGAVHLNAAPTFHIADFPFMFAAPAFGTCPVTIPKYSPESFCETVQRERVTHTVLVPTMINMLTQSPELQKYDLSTLRHLGYGGSPMAPELVHHTRQVLPKVKLVQVYGLSEAGFLTGLLDHEHTEDKLTSCGRPSIGIDVRVVDPTGKEVETGQN